MGSTGEFSIAFQLTQDCLFKCQICNRRFDKAERNLDRDARRQIIDRLHARGLRRLTITGGEPMTEWDDAVDLLVYAHGKRVHTCLSTTGYQLDIARLIILDEFLDQLLISIPTHSLEEWISFFGNSLDAAALYKFARDLLINVRETGIIMEVCTVVTKKNAGDVYKIGDMLADMNPDIIWKLEYYYPMGIYSKLSHRFSMPCEESDRIRNDIKDRFSGVFRDIYVTECARHLAPNIFITPQGDMVKTHSNRYSGSLGNVLGVDLEDVEFKMNRHWSAHNKYCRDWKWNNG